LCGSDLITCDKISNADKITYLYVMCETLVCHCFASLLVDKSFKDLFNPIEMLLLGMPVLVVKLYYNIKLGSPPPTLLVETYCHFHRFFTSFELLSTVHGNTP
jgi:hypothetical protein